MTLDKLAVLGWIDRPARDDMAEAYRFLRMVEHRLQMVNDDQTQTLPADPAALDGLARFAGFRGRDGDELAHCLSSSLRLARMASTFLRFSLDLRPRVVDGPSLTASCQAFRASA